MLVGLNIYFDYDTSALLAAARQLFPGQEEVVAETVNTYRPACHPLALWWAKFEALGEPEWKCAGTVPPHELGKPMAGNLLDADGTQYWHTPG